MNIFVFQAPRQLNALLEKVFREGLEGLVLKGINVSDVVFLMHTEFNLTDHRVENILKYGLNIISKF